MDIESIQKKLNALEAIVVSLGVIYMRPYTMVQRIQVYSHTWACLSDIRESPPSCSTEHRPDSQRDSDELCYMAGKVGEINSTDQIANLEKVDMFASSA